MPLLNHVDISGKDFNETHSEKIPQIFFKLAVFQIEISGMKIKIQY